jgi:hypothetical protein
MRYFALIAAPAAASFVACTSVESSSIKTAGMSAYMSVVADGTGSTTATTTLHVDNNLTDFVDLSSGDTLIASSGSQQQRLNKSSFLGATSYNGSFSGLDAEGTPYTIAFTRQSDTSAPSSTCTIPKPFTFSAPASTATFARATDDIVVQYGPSGTTDPMSYDVTGDCIKGSLQVNPGGDTGQFTIAHTTLPLQASDVHANDTCQVTLTLRRTRTGTLDSAFGHGGRIDGQQMRTLKFMSKP